MVTHKKLKYVSVYIAISNEGVGESPQCANTGPHYRGDAILPDYDGAVSKDPTHIGNQSRSVSEQCGNRGTNRGTVYLNERKVGLHTNPQYKR